MSGRISRDDTYWQKRLRAVERFSESYSRKAYSKIQSAFTLAERDIQKEINVWYARLAANNNISLSEAKRFLDRSELAEFKWDVAEYIKHSRESAVSGEWAKQLENASARVHISRLEALKIHTQHPLEKAFQAESDAVEEMARNIVEEDYYRTIFEVQRGVHIGWNIGEIDQRKLERIISKPWTTDGKTFSGRIWKRKRKMVHDLHQELTRSCIYGRPFEETVQKIEQYARSSVKNARYAAERLVRTETAYFRSISQKEALERIGVKWYKIDLTIDDRTCPICREMNGKIFPMSEFEIGVTVPPFHPNCDLGSMTPTSPENVEGEDELIDQILREIEGEEPLSEKERFEDWKKKFVYGNKVDKSKESGIIKQSVSDVKDFPELKSYMLDVYGVSIDDAVEKLDFESVCEGVLGIEKVIEEFPQAKASFKSVGVDNGGIMCARYSGDICFNPTYYKTRESAVKASSSTSHFHPTGNNVISTGSHEMGHILEKALIDKYNGSNPAGLVFWSDCIYAKAVVKEACKSAKKLPECKKMFNSRLKSDISGYAKTNDSECLAEAVADYVLNGDKAAVLSKEIWKILKKELG